MPLSINAPFTCGRPQMDRDSFVKQTRWHFWSNKRNIDQESSLIFSAKAVYWWDCSSLSKTLVKIRKILKLKEMVAFREASLTVFQYKVKWISLNFFAVFK